MEAITSGVTTVFAIMTSAVTFITSTPLLFIPVLIGVVGAILAVVLSAFHR